MLSGSQHLPLTVIVIKHSFEELKISPLNRKHKPDASLRFEAIGISTDTRNRFALLSIFNARLLQISRNLSVVTNEPSSLFDSPMWSLKVQLLHIMQDKTTLEWQLYKIKQKGHIENLKSLFCLAEKDHSEYFDLNKGSSNASICIGSTL